jgi:hypothetical protein
MILSIVPLFDRVLKMGDTPEDSLEAIDLFGPPAVNERYGMLLIFVILLLFMPVVFKFGFSISCFFC